MRYLSAEDVRAAVSMPEAIAAMRSAFAQKGRDRSVAPVRTVLATDAGHTLVMPAYLGDSGDLAVKVVSVVPGNPDRGLPRIVGLVIAFDAETGLPRGLLDGAAVTALRTGAVSGLATDMLARPDAAVLAVIGAGALAADQIAAIAAVRRLREVRVYAPTRARAEGVCARIPIARVAGDAREAVRGADVVVTATTSTAPVFDDADLADGAHVCAVGAWRPQMQEIPAATMARATVIADDRAAAWEESGDLVQAHAAGAIGPDHVLADLADLVCGRFGRTRPDEVTLFESVGLAIEDAALAGVALANAETRALGIEFAGPTPSPPHRGRGSG